MDRKSKFHLFGTHLYSTLQSYINTGDVRQFIPPGYYSVSHRRITNDFFESLTKIAIPFKRISSSFPSIPMGLSIFIPRPDHLTATRNHWILAVICFARLLFAEPSNPPTAKEPRNKISRFEMLHYCLFLLNLSKSMHVDFRFSWGQRSLQALVRSHKV